MAISADMSRPTQAKSPLRPSPASSPQAPSAGMMAPRIDDRRVSARVNNLYGRGGAGEMALQGMDRAGVSRGRGQRHRADMAAAAQYSNNRADAMRAETGASQANTAAAQQYDAMRNSERLMNEGLLQNLRDSGRRERMARRSAELDAYETTLRNQFNLDSMQLDGTPLLNRLFS